jgi:hypothetical protein
VDPQTQVGIGSGALFVIVGVATPLFGWQIGGSLMAACAAVAVWGFWPLLGSYSMGHRSLWRVPVSMAAQICFEKAEGTPAGDIIGAEYRNEDERISFLYSSFVARHIPLFGRVPPSRIARQIPDPALRNLTLVEGTNNLQRIAGQGQTEYLDVYMLRTDLWKHIKHLRRARRAEDI